MVGLSVCKHQPCSYIPLRGECYWCGCRKASSPEHVRAVFSDRDDFQRAPVHDLWLGMTWKFGQVSRTAGGGVFSHVDLSFS
jgi:hypothetical protein